MKRISLLTLAIFFATTQLSHAEILSLFEFSSDANGNENLVSSDTNLDSFSSSYSTRGGALGLNIIGNPFSGTAPNHVFVSAAVTPDSLDPTINNVFHEFSTTVQDGEWNLDSITFDYWVDNAPDGGEFNVSVFSDRTGFGSAADSLGTFTLNTTTGNAGLTETLNFPTNPSLENLVAGDSTNFRLYFSDNQTTGLVHRIDSVVLRGSLQSVPEPASAVVLGAIVLVFGMRRRRKVG